jgi:hypothetical protein
VYKRQVLKDLTIHYVDNIGEVIELAFPEASEDVMPFVHHFDVWESEPVKPGLRV